MAFFTLLLCDLIVIVVYADAQSAEFYYICVRK